MDCLAPADDNDIFRCNDPVIIFIRIADDRFFNDGVPSGGEYLTSPEVNRAEELKIAVIGALLIGSPIPKLITGSPRSRSTGFLIESKSG